VNGKQQYGNPLLQDKNLMNLNKIDQTVTHIFKCDIYAVIRMGGNGVVVRILWGLCVIKN